MSLKILLVVIGLHGFVFTMFVQKPPGFYFFASSILMIATLGNVLSNGKRPTPLKIFAAAVIATGGQQLIVGFLAPESSRIWLTLQFIALQIFTLGAMLPVQGGHR